MALLNPTLEIINKQKVPPSEGELNIIKFLSDHLDDNYEIFFQPYINGDRPDIVLMRKGSGVLIIEVKDWNLNNYYIENIENIEKWRLRKNGVHIRSPLFQVQSYKNNLYELHINNLLEKKLNNPKLFSVVACAVYFHNENENSIQSFFSKNFNKESIEHFILIGRDTLTKKKLNQILYENWLNRCSKFFDNYLYKNFKRHLSPPIHTIEQGIEVQYTKKQSELIESKPIHQKIKGVAGSGKTKVLAKRAVNAHKRTNKRVLILTFNITLKNYIHDKISEVREKFMWDCFYINNYHNFINTEMNNFNICYDIPKGLEKEKLNNYLERNFYSNEKIFKDVEEQIEKYDAIFIDEIQDYKTEWLKIIRKYFLAPGAEFVVFGDEKQNIYDRQLDADKSPNTGIPGRWNILDKSFRLNTKIMTLAIEFQKHFLNKKYNIDAIEVLRQQTIFDFQDVIEYHYFEANSEKNDFFLKIINIIQNINIHPNDICIISSKVDILIELDSLINKRLNQKTDTTFETKDNLAKLDKKENRKKEIEKIRKNNKHNLPVPIFFCPFFSYQAINRKSTISKM